MAEVSTTRMPPVECHWTSLMSSQHVMALCPQATSHNLSQCWARSLSPYGITRPQYVKATNIDHGPILLTIFPSWFKFDENFILLPCKSHVMVTFVLYIIWCLCFYVVQNHWDIMAQNGTARNKCFLLNLSCLGTNHYLNMAYSLYLEQYE